ncbi:uncharacterized protein LOC34620175 [Cyclospora cayetanensis]|uniref:Uncharacterized protein LOC34620175 n=1 Tax=Cyclospora cayetanensis TaxID=88456 RepID=A0A6P6RZC7_9EIME|nr:uncharacterized protein LOC34620175 [Cyclospora cayetanensis]
MGEVEAAGTPSGVAVCRLLLLRLLRSGYSAAEAAAALKEDQLLQEQQQQELTHALAELLDECLQRKAADADAPPRSTAAAKAESQQPQQQQREEQRDLENEKPAQQQQELQLEEGNAEDGQQSPPAKRARTEPPPASGCGDTAASGGLQRLSSGGVLLQEMLSLLVSMLQCIPSVPEAIKCAESAAAASSCMRLCFSNLSGVQAAAASEAEVFSSTGEWQALMDQRVAAFCQLLAFCRRSAAAAAVGSEDEILWKQCSKQLLLLRQWSRFFAAAQSEREALTNRIAASSYLQDLPSILGDSSSNNSSSTVEEALSRALSLLRQNMPLIGSNRQNAAAAAREAEAKLQAAAERWRAEQIRRQQQQQELLRRSAFSRACVAFVLQRQQEQKQAAAAAAAAPLGTTAASAAAARSRAIGHPFYLIGVNPHTATEAVVAAARKKWRALLHPDKFHHSQEVSLQQQATEAFKAYEEACVEALRMLRSRTMDILWTAPPPPPSVETATAAAATTAAAAASGTAATGLAAGAPAATAASGSASSVAGSGNSNQTTNSNNTVQIPNTLYMPDATVEVLLRRKATGAFRVYVQAASAAVAAPEDGADAAAAAAAASAFRCITKVWVYVHRPVRGGPPVALQPDAGNLSCVMHKEVLLSAAADEAAAAAGRSSSNEIYLDIPAVQPLVLEKQQRYWVGVQVQSRKKHISLISWLPLHVTVCVPPLPQLQQLHQEEEGSLFSEDEDKKKHKRRQATRPHEVLSTAAKSALALLQTFNSAPFLSSPLQQQLQQQLHKLQQHIAAAADGHQKTALKSCRLAVTEARELLQQCMQQAEAWVDTTTD